MLPGAEPPGYVPKQKTLKFKKYRLPRFAVVNFAILVLLWLLEWLSAKKLDFDAADLRAAAGFRARHADSSRHFFAATRPFCRRHQYRRCDFSGCFSDGLSSAFSDSTPPDLRVMTFNVEKWSHGTENVAAAIRGQKPDVVCLQEAGKYFWLTGTNQRPSALEKAMPEYVWTASGEMMVGSRLPVLETHLHPLPPGPKERPAVEVVVKVGEKRVSVVAVHLIPSQFDNVFRESGKGTKFYIDAANGARRTQAARLLDELKNVKNPIVIGGDFNAQPQTQVCQTLTNVYTDAFGAVGNGFGYTLIATFPATRVDHILTGGGIRATTAVVPNVIASDHRPLVADLALP